MVDSWTPEYDVVGSKCCVLALLLHPGARDLWSVKIPLTYVGWLLC